MMQVGGSNHDGFNGKAWKSFEQGNDVIHIYDQTVSFGVGGWQGNNSGSEENNQEGIKTDYARGDGRSTRMVTIDKQREIVSMVI